jgi:hypothetical protein
MDEAHLKKIDDGLDRLIREYKQNKNKGDDVRLKRANEAKKAFRKVLMAFAIIGDIEIITPIIHQKAGAGWMTISKSGESKTYMS